MNISIGQLGAKARAFWQGASRGLKLRLLIGVVLGLSLVGAVVFFSRPSYDPLFTNLAPADAGEIGQRLQELKVPYRLGGDGKSILVPRDKVYDLRNRLAMEGLPKGNAVGFEIFDQTKLGVTDFERRVQYLRALQGELARTIGQMDGVRSASVQIVLPEDRLYQKDTRPPTASVLLDTVGQMGADKVRAIMHLVSHSVEGLTPENITVVDTSGQVLSDLVQTDDTPVGLSSSQLALQRSVEREIERSTQSMLETVLGPGMVVTRVKAELNFDQREVTNEFFQPVANDEGILRSMQELQKTFDGQSGPQGTPGTPANIPPTYQTGAGGPSHYEERQVTRNYEVNQTKEHLVVAPGSVRHLSVAVMVNGNLTPAQQQAIQSAVTNAVGLQPNRGDQISVVSFPFQGQPLAQQAAAQAAADQAARRQRLLVLVALGASLLVLAVFLVRRLRRRAPAEVVPLPVAGAEEEAAPAREETERDRIRKEVERLARQRPQEVAQLLATWLSE
ncbi:flagellar basal-body MS-ring/collar protein FliF [Gelria sp. Kuro-4]|uniref:flagellar basal-body MS-ring/collar protein FliF n=1 Tax=Gelria sp. Kuro-4 TaxID=2796927 RepID=UPI001BEDDAE7|nr:flagellar basal-body MS-ring/collar protein FliF [Gelria sp. Kuro-4]BCV24920.1 flagellar M-ring protein [Gelria sp. Kuro-4]